MKTQRVYVEKRADFSPRAESIKVDLKHFFAAKHPELARLEKVRILNRYDLGGLDEDQLEKTVNAALCEPGGDIVHTDNPLPDGEGWAVFAVEYLPGQYDQRLDSARQSAAVATGVVPDIRRAEVYALYCGGQPLSAAALSAVKEYFINPLEAREAALHEAAIDAAPGAAGEGGEPAEIPVLTGFASAGSPEEFAREWGLAMSAGDLAFCKDWFSSIGRDPTLAELKVLDTYWSDHCRHSTFYTNIEEIEVEGGAPLSADIKNALAQYEAARDEVYGPGAARPRSLMDMAQIGFKVLKKRGIVKDIDESKEINACTVKIQAQFADGKGGVKGEPWFLLFKNETHNHPTEIEPVGGASTCLGGAIRDPLSGRAYVYQAMRITGAGSPLTPPGDTLPGKIPQLKLARVTSQAYSSYGQQVGVAASLAQEFYHPGFLAKRMEMGALVGAVPQSWVQRGEPQPGDVVILVGWKTGRDGIGGATGSSKADSQSASLSVGAVVPKGDAVTGRRLQRLYRNSEVSRLIKRSNDFGAGGVSVAVGEIAAGLDIDLDKVPPAYGGLGGLDLAISESQERMAVVVAAGDASAFIKAAACENLEATVIATVTAVEGDKDAAVRMFFRGKTIVDLKREFLNANGAPRFSKVKITAGGAAANDGAGGGG
ncbi:MAG: AIR synthase-related protein, partial [Spirochaetes bacterium]|nr:AIR synthase-related protein [Spirochaetota bacterium]